MCRCGRLAASLHGDRKAASCPGSWSCSVFNEPAPQGGLPRFKDWAAWQPAPGIDRDWFKGRRPSRPPVGG